LSISAGAQTVRGTIKGAVVASGKPVESAKVTIRNDETGREMPANAAGPGRFALSSLAPGRYTVKAEAPGFAASRLELTLFVNQDADVTLELGAAQVATVQDRTPLLKTDSASVSGVIDSQQIRGLPLDGRNFYELGLLLPGVASSAQGSAGSVRGEFAINVNGAREDSNLFLLDGVYNADPKLNGIGVQPPVDAVREFELLTNSYDAAFGRNAGGQVNVVLRSGTNQLHGSAWEFFRNDKLDERNYFAPAGEPAPKNRRNQFGFTLGGALVKNRTFFFVDYEGRRVREGITRLTNVPGARERQGDFSQTRLPAINPQTGQPFPGNVIPAVAINPIAARLLARYPLPNRTGAQNFVSSPTQRDRNDHFDVRLDHAITSRTELSGRYSRGDRDLYEPFSGPGFAAVPGYGTNIPRVAHNAMVSLTHSFTPAFLNELRLGFNRVNQSTQQENIGTNLNQQVGLPAPWGANARRNGLSLITIAGFSPLGDEYNNPQSGITNTYQLIDQLSWTRGRHLLKAGFEFRNLQQNAFRDVQARGFINFTGLVLGNSLAEALIGLPTFSGLATVDNPQYLRAQSYAFFVQDQFRVTPKLTLNFGIRYEYNTPAVDKFDRANVYDPAAGRLAALGQNGFPRGAFNPDRNNLAPRVGLSYALTSKTVLRAGYGFYYDQGALAPSEGLYFSAPYYNFRLYFLNQNPPVFLSLFDPWPRNFPFPTPSSATAFQRDLKTPYLQHWNFAIQQQVGSAATVQIGYAGSKGTKLYGSRDINQPRPSLAPFVLRPNPQFDDINIQESNRNSNYHSLQASWQQRLQRGVTALFSYTYAKSMDNASGFFSSFGDPNFPQDSANLRAERGRSNFDVRQRAVMSFTYDLPFGKGRLLGGWQALGILTFQTGRPFTVALQSDFDNSNTGRSVLGFGANDRPNVVGNVNDGPRTATQWFNTRAFAVPPRGTFGNAGRNIGQGPGLQTWNLSLIKNTFVTERVNVQFRAEFFNAFDRANFGLPGNQVGLPDFGVINTAGDPRRIQLGLKLLF
jgi:hypothetical protein